MSDDDKKGPWGAGDDLERERLAAEAAEQASKEINAAQATAPGPMDEHLGDSMPDVDGAAYRDKPVNGASVLSEASPAVKAAADRAAARAERQDEAKRLQNQTKAEAALERLNKIARQRAEMKEGGEKDEFTEEELALDSHTTMLAPQVFAMSEPGNPVTPDEMMQFLQLYATHGVWNYCAYAIGRSGKTFRDLAKKDPIFAIMVGEAVQDFREGMQMEVIRRGRHGWLEPVFAGKDGDLVGYVRKFSDTCLKMELEAAWPARYRPNHREQQALPTGQQSGVMVVPGVAKSSEEWKNAVANRPASRTLDKVTRKVERPPSGEVE